MGANITLTAENGPFKGKNYVFTKSQKCLVGRSDDCELQLRGDFEFQTISRHHCLLDIDLPRVLVLDLGSCNGTFINGRRIPPYGAGQGLGEAPYTPFAAYELDDGDELALAGMVFKIHVNLPAKDQQPADVPAVEEDPFLAAPADGFSALENDPEKESPFAFVGCAQAFR